MGLGLCFRLRELMGNICRKMWSCICCRCSRNKAQTRSQKGSYLSKGRVHPVTKIENWEEKITEANSNGLILVVHFTASWCLPCRKLAPIYQELASTYTSMLFVTIDVEELAEFSNEWNVEATPTVVFLKDGKQIMDKLVGGDVAELQKKTAAAAELLLRQS